jgi:NAD-dependent deacetylase
MKFEHTLIEKLRQAHRIVFFTGAGVSQESGIPTFRDGPTSIWKHFDPEVYATVPGFDNNPTEVWEWYWEQRQAFKALEPNAAHSIIAAWQKKVQNVTVITQNIDGFHQRAGNQSVIELHGSLAMDKCRAHGHSIEHEVNSASKTQPSCSECGSLLRPDVVWFGESLSDAAYDEAEMACFNCDVFICIGCSMNIYPAANLPYIASASGAYLVQVNPNLTNLDESAHCNLRGNAGEVMPALWKAVWKSTFIN